MSKVLPDQFLIENMNSYSGSYLDRVSYGNMFSKPTTFIESTGGGKTFGMLQCYPDGYSSIVDFRRGTLALLTSATSASKANSFAVTNRTMWLSDYIQMVHGRYIPSRTANYSLQLADETECYYDSYTPNLFQMYKINGGSYASNTDGAGVNGPRGTFVEINLVHHYSGSRVDLANPKPYTVEDFTYPYISNSLGIILTNLGTNYSTAADSPYASIDDTQWRNNCPYTVKYKNLIRNNKLSRILPYPVTPTTNMAGSSSLYSITSNIISTVAIYSSGTRADSATYVSLNPWKTNSQNLQFLSDVVMSGSEGERLFKQCQTDLSVSNQVVNRQAVSNLSTVQNVFFCLGKNGTMYNWWNNGFYCRNFPEFHVNTFYSTMAPIIRGFKYGIYKANSTSTRAHWRRDKFGQFRDRLEQRQYSKFFYNKESNTTYDPSKALIFDKKSPSTNVNNYENPIKINFIPGTQAYLTSSQYAAFNPDIQPIAYLSNSRESGIYDFEYRSALPFEDRDVI